MNNRMKTACFFTTLALTVLACQAVSGVQERVGDTRKTVEAAATSIGQGRELLGTAQAITTQIGGQDLIPTAQALATQLGESGAIETARAVVTEQGPAIIETARAIATQEGPAALGTVQAYATQFAQSTPAQDIPLIEAGRDAFIQAPNLISYTTSLPIDQALEFYKAQMPKFGWERVDREGFETAAASLLSYQKGERKATVSLGSAPGGGSTLVIIIIEP